jgi:glycosyltransferase involved in cell wall biosynthesis
MSIELSVIIVEHNETKSFIDKMVSQAKLLSQYISIEVIFVSSLPFSEFYIKYGEFNEKFPISVIGNIQNPGSGRSIGARSASGDNLCFMDCHVCFTPDKVIKLLSTLNKHPNDFVAPALQDVEFPECKFMGGIAYGVGFSFIDQPYQWEWKEPSSKNHEYQSPFACACQFFVKKKTMNHLLSFGGFLSPPVGVGMEEEIFMRAQRLGHKVYIDPTVVFGHMFKGYPGKPGWDEHSNSGWFFPRVAAIYVNVFDQELWKKIEAVSSRVWGEGWYKNLDLAKIQYSWLRYLMKPYAQKIDENWFFRT